MSDMKPNELTASPKSATRPETNVGSPLTSLTAHFDGLFIAYHRTPLRQYSTPQQFADTSSGIKKQESKYLEESVNLWTPLREMRDHLIIGSFGEPSSVVRRPACGGRGYQGDAVYHLALGYRVRQDDLRVMYSSGV